MKLGSWPCFWCMLIFLHIFSFNFMHHYSLLELVTWLSQKGVSNTLIHLWNESAFFMNILKASCRCSQLIFLRFIAERSELFMTGHILANFISSLRHFQISLYWVKLLSIIKLFSIILSVFHFWFKCFMDKPKSCWRPLYIKSFDWNLFWAL